MNTREEVALVNGTADASLRKFSAPARQPGQKKGLLWEVLNYDKDVASSCLGRMGESLFAFAAAADLDHPDISKVAGGKISGASDYVRLASELLSLAGHAKSKGMTLAPPYFHQIIGTKADHGFVTVRISDPEKVTGSNLRFVKDPTLRNASRSKKRAQNANLVSFYAKKADPWEIVPGSFHSFVRNEVPYADTIAQTGRKIEHFKSLGLSDTAAEMNAGLESVLANVGEPYYGFNRCPVNLASVTLAKVHGFEFRGTFKSVERLKISETLLRSVKEAGILPLVQKHAGSQYQPRIYAAANMATVPPRVADRMDLLEKFPEVGDKPLFDNFHVVVPSLSNDGDTKGEVTAGHTEVDQAMIASGCVVPALLGETDSKFYFICYWC